MPATIFLRIVTPEGVKLSEEVDEFTAPSEDGEFGVLAEHRPLMAGLKTGIVRYRRGDETVAVAVGPGFAKVAFDQANLIVERFSTKDEVDAVVARKDLKEAQEGLGKLGSDAAESEWAELVSASRWAAARLELYGDAPPATVVLAHEMRRLAQDDYSAPAESSEEPGDEASA